VPFRPDHQKQLLLLPPDLESMIPEKDLVRVIDRFVESLPKRTIEGRLWKKRGRPAYGPRMMLKVLLYAYSQRVYSSRQIAKACRQNLNFLWLSGMARPDFNTVNRFRSVYLAECLEAVFGRLAEMLLEQGYVRGRDYFVDGTLVEADAGKYTAVWRKNAERYAARVRERAKAILDEVERINRAEDEEYGERDLEETGDGTVLTAEAIEEAAKRLAREWEEKESKAKPERKPQEQQERRRQVRRLEQEAEKLRKYEAQQAELGERNSYSKTDPGASFMRMKSGELRAGYNLQIGTENGFIVGYSLSQSPHDGGSLGAHLEARERHGLEAAPERVIADAGYGSEENYEVLAERRMEAYVKYPGWHREVTGKLKRFEKAAFRYDDEADEFICPEGRRLVREGEGTVRRKSGYVAEEVYYRCGDCGGCRWKAECTLGEANRTLTHLPNLAAHQAKVRQRLTSEEGVALRKRRGWEVETRFGMMKRNLGFTRFRLRGWAKATLEIGYLVTAMNLMRLASPKAQPI
jgi:transposase